MPLSFAPWIRGQGDWLVEAPSWPYYHAPSLPSHKGVHVVLHDSVVHLEGVAASEPLSGSQDFVWYDDLRYEQ